MSQANRSRSPLATTTVTGAFSLLLAVVVAIGAAAADKQGQEGVPDLVVGKLSVPAQSLAPGQAFELATTVKNTGEAKAKKSKLLFSFSADTKASKDDLVIGAPVKVAALKPNEKAKPGAELAVPAEAAGALYLIACAKPVAGEKGKAAKNNCRASTGPVSIGSPPAAVGPGPAIPSQPVAGPPPPGDGEQQPPPGDGGQEPPPDDEQPWSASFSNPDADPINVEPTLQAARAQTKLIPVEGATISATAADGTAFELSFPENSVISEVEVTMTPIASLGGSPYSGLAGGVQLEPDGLRLAEPATLTVTPPEPVPVEERSPFAYRSDGLDFRLAIFEAVGDSFELPIFHFTGQGIAKGNRIQRTSVAQSQPYSFEWKYDNDIATAVLEGDFDAAAAAFVSHYDAKLGPALRRATTASVEEMHFAKAAVQEFIAMARQFQLLGGDGYPGVQERIDAGLALVPQIVRNMLDNSFRQCTEANQPEYFLIALGLERQLQLIGVNDEDSPFAPGGRGERCLRFELDFASTIHAATDSYGESRRPGTAGVGAEATVGVADLPLRLNGELGLSGEKQLSYLAYRTWDDPCVTNDGVQLGLPFEVIRFDPDLQSILGRGPDGTPVLDPRRTPLINLLFSHGSASEWFTRDGDGCTGDPNNPDAPITRVIYYSGFSSIHADERLRGSCGRRSTETGLQRFGGDHTPPPTEAQLFSIDDWRLQAPWVATKSYSRSAPYCDPNPGFQYQITESTEFTITHTPVG